MTMNKTISKELPTNLSSRRIRGQGMTEYIIIVALIALAAITLVGLFGETVQQQFAGMAQTLAGEDNSVALEAAADSAQAAEDGAGAAGLNSYGQ